MPPLPRHLHQLIRPILPNNASIKPFHTYTKRLHQNPLGIPGRGGSPPTIPRMQRGLPIQTPIPGIKHIVAVASAKGGVGKSTTSVNLALSLSNYFGKRVGVLDADLFGPSIPRMMNVGGEPGVDGDKKMLIPLTNYGISLMSMGFLIPDDNPVVWRGLMVMKALDQLMRQVNWSYHGELDILVIDLPPGTGDTQLTITQNLPISGAVVVSTPQDVAMAVTKRGVDMFRKVKVPVLGVVENMAYLTCPNCGTNVRVFANPSSYGDESGNNNNHLSSFQKKFYNENADIELLGQIPLNPELCATMDIGKPIVIVDPEAPISQVYKSIAGKIIDRLYN